MEQIASFAQTLQHLKQQEIVCTITHHNVSYYYLKDKRIVVNSPNARYTLTLEQFKQLIANETFYLYQSDENTIDPLKDEEYYAWKSKGTN